MPIECHRTARRDGDEGLVDSDSVDSNTVEVWANAVDILSKTACTHADEAMNFMRESFIFT